MSVEEFSSRRRAAELKGGGQITIGQNAGFDCQVALDQVIVLDRHAPQVPYIEWGSDWQYSPITGKWHRAGVVHAPDGTVTGTVDEEKLIDPKQNGKVRTVTVRTERDNTGAVVKKTKKVVVSSDGPPRSIEARGYEWVNGQWVQTWSASLSVRYA